MSKKNRIGRWLFSSLFFILAVLTEIFLGKKQFNGATFLAAFLLIIAVIIFTSNKETTQKAFKELFYLKVYDEYDEEDDDDDETEDEIDQIPWIDPSKYEGSKKEGIMLEFPKSD